MKIVIYAYEQDGWLVHRSDDFTIPVPGNGKVKPTDLHQAAARAIKKAAERMKQHQGGQKKASGEL